MKAKSRAAYPLIFLFLMSLINSKIEIDSVGNNPYSQQNLRKQVLKGNLKIQRELSLAGKLSLSKSNHARWGIDTLNKHFAQERNLPGESLNQNSKIFSNQVNMMSLSDQVFSFIDRHKMNLKKQKEVGNEIKFIMNRRKTPEDKFQIRVAKQGLNYNVHFVSKEPYMRKTFKVSSKDYTESQLRRFLDSNFKLWKKYGSRVLKVVETSPSGDQTRRKLFELADIKSVMDKSVSEVLKVDVDGEAEEAWNLMNKDDDTVIAKISVDKSGEFPLVMISNLELKEFENSFKMSSRGVTPQDEENDLQLFFEPHFKEFEDRFAEWKDNRVKLTDIETWVIDEAKGLSKHDVKSKVKAGTPENPLMIVMKDQVDEKQPLLFEAVIYQIKIDYSLLHMYQGNNEMEIQVPAIMSTEQREQTKTSIKLFMSGGEYFHSMSFETATELFVKVLKSMFCKSAKAEFPTDQPISIVSIAEDKNCELNNKKFLVAGVKLGGEQFLQILFDNDYFKSEHFLTITTDTLFRESLSRVVRESIGHYKEVDKAFKMSQEPSKLSLEQIEERINEKLNDKVKLTADSTAETKTYQANAYGKLTVVLRVTMVEEPDQPSFYKIMIYDISREGGLQKPRAHSEFVMYENNGYDQLKLLDDELEDLNSRLK